MTWILILGAFFASAKVTKDQIRFNYQPHDSPGASCTHERIRDLPDWKVICRYPNRELQFKVHLVIRRADRGKQFSAFEVLYWVMHADQQKHKNIYTGTSMMFSLDGLMKSREIRIGQAVQNHYADLNLIYKP